MFKVQGAKFKVGVRKAHKSAYARFAGKIFLRPQLFLPRSFCERAGQAPGPGAAPETGGVRNGVGAATPYQVWRVPFAFARLFMGARAFPNPKLQKAAWLCAGRETFQRNVSTEARAFRDHSRGGIGSRCPRACISSQSQAGGRTLSQCSDRARSQALTRQVWYLSGDGKAPASVAAMDSGVSFSEINPV